MPQAVLHLFPADVTPINNLLSFAKREGMVYYFHGCFPVFCHAENDQRSFRMFTSQLYVNGSCKQREVVRAFGVSAISVKRWAKKYRGGGVGAFFTEGPKRKPRVLKPEVLARAQELLSEGLARSEVSKELGLKPDTVYKAVQSGLLVEGKKKEKKPGAKASGV